MLVVIMTIVISLLLAAGALISFLWAVKSGQYDDPYTPAVRILQDDLPVQKTDSSNHQQTMENN